MGTTGVSGLELALRFTSATSVGEDTAQPGGGIEDQASRKQRFGVVVALAEVVEVLVVLAVVLCVLVDAADEVALPVSEGVAETWQ